MQAVGRTPNGMKVKKGLFPWTASGRAIANGRDEGVQLVAGFSEVAIACQAA
jgi:hypothetical protein